MAAVNFLNRNVNLIRLTHCVRKYNENVILGRLVARLVSRSSRAPEVSTGPAVTLRKNDEDSGDIDLPVKYSTSKAATWTVRESYGARKKEDMPPEAQTWSVLISVVAFMLYFCVFREENDLDDELRVSLYDRVEGLEEIQLNLVIKDYKERGLDTKDLEARLVQVENEKLLKNSKKSELQ